MCKGGGSSKGSTTTTQVNSLDPAISQAYQDLVTQAKGVASTPYEAYQGQLVAGLTPQQQQAISQIDALQGMAQPYYNTAAQYAAKVGQPIEAQQFSDAAVQKYMDPYLGSVVNAVQGNIQQSNQIQQRQLMDKAISSGASPFGGDRAGIAAAELARTQNLAEQQTISGLYSQGYQNALNQFNQQQNVDLQTQLANAQNAQGAAGLYANLGTQAQNTALSGAAAQLQAGTLAQQQNQAQLTSNYDQWLKQKYYPFETTSWLGNIVQGIGNQMPGSSSSTVTGTQPGMSAQNWTGLATAGIGLLGSFFGKKDGGRLNSGGIVPVIDMVEVEPGHFKDGGGAWSGAAGGAAGAGGGAAGAGAGSGGRGRGKGSDKEDREIARQVDKVRGLPGSDVGGTGRRGGAGQPPDSTRTDSWLDRAFGYDTYGDRRAAYHNNPNRPGGSNTVPVAYVPNFPNASGVYTAAAALDVLSGINPVGAVMSGLNTAFTGNPGMFSRTAEEAGYGKGTQEGDIGVGNDRGGRGGLGGVGIKSPTALAVAQQVLDTQKPLPIPTQTPTAPGVPWVPQTAGLANVPGKNLNLTWNPSGYGPLFPTYQGLASGGKPRFTGHYDMTEYGLTQEDIDRINGNEGDPDPEIDWGNGSAVVSYPADGDAIDTGLPTPGIGNRFLSPDNPWTALILAGLAAAGDRGPSPLATGAMYGIQAYQHGLDAAREARSDEAKEALLRERMGMERERFTAEQEAAQREADAVAARTQQIADFIATLPEDQQRMAMVDPEGFVKSIIENQGKAPTTAGGLMYDKTAGTWVPIPGYIQQQAELAAAQRAPKEAPLPPDRVRLAEAAGLVPGTKEYQDFLLKSGEGESWETVTDDKGKPIYQRSSSGKLAPMPGDEQGGKFKQANTLRDEYTGLTKDFRTIQDAYNKITSTSENGAGDMSLLYSYVKLLDPGSVVRESEFATAAASGSFGEQIQGAANRVMSGERLPETLRKSFKTEAKKIYDTQKNSYNQVGKEYKRLAEKAGIDPADVIVDYTVMSPEELNDTYGQPGK